MRASGGRYGICVTHVDVTCNMLALSTALEFGFHKVRTWLEACPSCQLFHMHGLISYLGITSKVRNYPGHKEELQGSTNNGS